ncbi:hypothetical protein X474_01810 [Dethiosulfatarculus sandiegensis]|uniref:Uncharacterized protein n=1 Tax=Dethiosulfatarculus sandiegensis TaxID=1429043 RepID=A0A0D2HZG7_9BACT|nr:hypothetical protein X474_01810 [Dethiosulfatarculus sandiegensis]
MSVFALLVNSMFVVPVPWAICPFGLNPCLLAMKDLICKRHR